MRVCSTSCNVVAVTSNIVVMTLAWPVQLASQHWCAAGFKEKFLVSPPIRAITNTRGNFPSFYYICIPIYRIAWRLVNLRLLTGVWKRFNAVIHILAFVMLTREPLVVTQSPCVIACYYRTGSMPRSTWSCRKKRSVQERSRTAGDRRYRSATYDTLCTVLGHLGCVGSCFMDATEIRFFCRAVTSILNSWLLQAKNT